MICIVFRSSVVALILVLCAGRAAATTVLTFEGLKSFEQVGNYYNGGYGSLGSGPGPNYGVTFSANGVAYIPNTPFINDPSPPTVLLDFNSGIGPGQPISTTMDVSQGFSGELDFYYLAIGRDVTVKIWSGSDGAGTMLAGQTFATTGTNLSNASFTVESMTFSGIAGSVVFTGGNDQLALDNIAFASVPEPSGWCSLTVGLASSFLVFFTWRRRTTTGSCPT